MTARTILAVLGALSMSVVLAGCGGAPDVIRAEPASAGDGATTYPFTLENCGEERRSGRPRRVR
jgi:iron complex transport system substrate-binding protein